MPFKLFRDAGTFFVMGAEEALDMLAVGGTAATYVDSDVEDGTADTADELGLGEGGTLEVEAPHNAVWRLALIVLDKGDGTYLLVELALREGFEEVATGILKYTWLYNHHAVYCCCYYVHAKVGSKFRIQIHIFS